MTQTEQTFSPVILNGYGKWIEELCIRYKLETILFRKTSNNYENALIQASSTKNVLAGVYNWNTDIGKIFDRRNTIRKEV